MPGIVGIISQKPSEECQHLVRSMLDGMNHECFYRSGTHFVPELGVYGGWVAIKGSFAANQVFVSNQKDVALLLAGECFPDPGLEASRNGDADAGIGTGGSWLLKLYEEAGDQFFERLNGLFSGLLIDKRRHRAILFNDRYGFERIYYCERKDGFYFASEAKALLAILPDLRAFNEQGVAQFLTFGCNLDWQTLFRGVQALPGASVWTFGGASTRKERYFCPADWEAQPALTEHDFESKLQETFTTVLPRYLHSGAEIGVSLTGGLDTRMIMACWPDGFARPASYTFAGETGETLDVRLASRVAKACGLDHRILRIGPDFFTNFASHADRTVRTTDGCFGILGTHEIYLNAQARRLAPVRLTGVFGSEVLRGMSTFKPIGLTRELFSPDLNHWLDASARRPSGPEEHPVTFAAFREIPWKLFSSFAAGRSQVNFRTPYLDNQIVALAYQAPGNLRKSPLAALRLVQNNSPVLGKIPTDRAHTAQAGLLGGRLKRVFSEVTFKFDYLYNEGMPHRLVRLDPLFGQFYSALRLYGQHRYLPYRRWFRTQLATHIQQVLTDTRVRQSGFWNPGFTERLAWEHITGRKNYLREINAVLTLEAIERLLIRNQSKAVERQSDLNNCEASSS